MLLGACLYLSALLWLAVAAEALDLVVLLPTDPPTGPNCVSCEVSAQAKPCTLCPGIDKMATLAVVAEQVGFDILVLTLTTITACWAIVTHLLLGGSTNGGLVLLWAWERSVALTSLALETVGLKGLKGPCYPLLDVYVFPNEHEAISSCSMTRSETMLVNAYALDWIWVVGAAFALVNVLRMTRVWLGDDRICLVAIAKLARLLPAEATHALNHSVRASS
uniref:Uncharacterized protein n=1 Tax=Fibrocapsa japonica TaxID=94617 RepID=A0A7S2UWV4_9STRA